MSNWLIFHMVSKMQSINYIHKGFSSSLIDQAQYWHLLGSKAEKAISSSLANLSVNEKCPELRSNQASFNERKYILLRHGSYFDSAMEIQINSRLWLERVSLSDMELVSA